MWTLSELRDNQIPPTSRCGVGALVEGKRVISRQQMNCAKKQKHGDPDTFCDQGRMKIPLMVCAAPASIPTPDQ